MDRRESSHIPAGDLMMPIARRINQSYAEFVDLLAEADGAQEWLADGSPDLPQWLNARFGIQPKLGHRLVRISRRLIDLPETRRRFQAGELSLDAVDLISEVATPQTEADLLEATRGGDLHDLARAVSRAKPPTAEDSHGRHEAEWMSTQWDLHHQKMSFSGSLAGAHAQLVEDRLVEVAGRTPKNLETGQHHDWWNRMAEALVETCATSGDGNAPATTLVVHADVSVLEGQAHIDVAELARGPVISKELAEMIGCDASVQTTIYSNRKSVGIGRKTRRIPGWLRGQVEYRDHHCRAPGCGRASFLQMHHLKPWSLGGATDLDNLILLCWWHHRFIHEKGWHITRGDHGRFVFRRPDWTPHPARGP